MEELVKKIAQEAGIPEEKAKIAADAAIDYIKKRVATTIDTRVSAALQNMTMAIKAEVHEAVTGEPAETFFEKLGDFAEDAKDKLEDIAEGAKEKFSDFAKSAKSFFSFGGNKKVEDKKEEEKK